MKIKLIILFILVIVKQGWSNMASPYEEGTKGSLPFINQYVEIEKEIIKIELGESFEEAKFNVEYYLKVNKEGIQIPLLFQALGFKKGFKIKLNDTIEVELKDIPSKYLSDSTLSGFQYFLDEDMEFSIWWDDDFGDIEELRYLKYFEIDLPVGIHKINIEYYGSPWLNKLDWIKKYTYRYSLYPAKYWKSFKNLVIELDSKSFQGEISTNLGEPQFRESDHLMIWNFNELPANSIEIEYKPKAGKLASLLITISPIGISILFSVILITLHLIVIKEYRKKSSKKFSVVVILGGIILPLLIIIGYINSFGLIDLTIGENASNYHGYTFLAIFLYPIILIPYMVITWQVDLYWKRKFELRKNENGL